MSLPTGHASQRTYDFLSQDRQQQTTTYDEGMGHRGRWLAPWVASCEDRGEAVEPLTDKAEVELSADDLDKEQIEQLHAATLQVSGNCFELKKLCATVLVAAGTLIVTLNRTKLDHALFIGGLVVAFVFWTADAQSYYIQAKLRTRMKNISASTRSTHDAAESLRR